ncbi:MAG TPA: DoxX family protein [Xanthobacteraceae bacterium]|nr:DoxX family protein [Xanthobacteraceae bacterium]
MSDMNRSSSHPWLSYTDTIATARRDQLLLAARILAGWIYFQGSWDKLADIPRFAGGLARRGVPLIFGYLAPFVEGLGGLSLMLGFATRYTALLLILFTAGASWTSHRYWLLPAAEQGRQATQFWKNVTMMGGLLAIFVTAGGRFSIDRLLQRRS